MPKPASKLAHALRLYVKRASTTVPQSPRWSEQASCRFDRLAEVAQSSSPPFLANGPLRTDGRRHGVRCRLGIPMLQQDSLLMHFRVQAGSVNSEPPVDPRRAARRVRVYAFVALPLVVIAVSAFNYARGGLGPGLTTLGGGLIAAIWAGRLLLRRYPK